MNTEKRPVGRPRTGKVKVMLTLDPQLLKATDQLARQAGKNRSVFVGDLLRAQAKSFLLELRQ